MSRFSRRQRCRRRQHLFALAGAEPMRICVGFCLNIFCSIWLVTHLYSARPGQASRCVRNPATTCFVWKRHWQGYDLDIAFKSVAQEPGRKAAEWTWAAGETVHRDSPAKRGASEPRQRSAAGHEAWLLSGAWSLGLESACHIQGYGCSIQGFGPLSLPYPGVRICPVGLNQACPVGLNQAGRVQDFYWKNDPEGWQVFGFSWILKFEMHTGPFEGFGPEPTWFQKFQVFLMQPCGLFQLLSCSRFAFPSPGISGYVAPWQVYGTFPFGSKYNGRGRIQDTKQKPRSSSSVSRAGTLVNPIFCTPDLESYSAT